MYLRSFESDSLQCRKAIVLRVFSLLYSASEEITLKNIWALLTASSSFFFFFIWQLVYNSLDEFTPNLYQPRFKVFNICKDEFARAETFSTNFHFTNPRGLNCITRKVKRPRKLVSLLSLTFKVAEGL